MGKMKIALIYLNLLLGASVATDLGKGCRLEQSCDCCLGVVNCYGTYDVPNQIFKCHGRQSGAPEVVNGTFVVANANCCPSNANFTSEDSGFEPFGSSTKEPPKQNGSDQWILGGLIGFAGLPVLLAAAVIAFTCVLVRMRRRLRQCELAAGRPATQVHLGALTNTQMERIAMLLRRPADGSGNSMPNRQEARVSSSSPSQWQNEVVEEALILATPV